MTSNQNRECEEALTFGIAMDTGSPAWRRREFWGIPNGMRGFVVIGCLLSCLLFCYCGKDDSSASAKRDFVGTSAPHPRALAQESVSDDADGKMTIDLIVDLAFRFERDGWTLTSPESHVTVDKMRQAGIDLVFFAVGNHPDNRPDILADIATTRKLVKQTRGSVQLVTGLEEAVRVNSRGGIAAMILIEGVDGPLMRADLVTLRKLRSDGVFVVGPVSGKSNALAEAAVSELSTRKGGLTQRGAEFVQTLREARMAVNMTHMSRQAFYDTLVTEGVLGMVSHSGCRFLREHPRNLDDLQLVALSRYGGIMGLVLNPDLLVSGGNTATMSDVIAHFQHMKRIDALNAAALGTDFNGIHPPVEMKDISSISDLKSNLLREGFAAEEVDGIFGENARRYIRNVEAGHGSMEISDMEVLRPLAVDCDMVSGDYTGTPAASCDGYLLTEGPTISSSGKQRFRLQEVRRTPVLLEIFGVPGTPLQVEAQALDGDILLKRGVRLDESGIGRLPLTGARQMVRLIISPTRTTVFREVVVWGR